MAKRALAETPTAIKETRVAPVKKRKVAAAEDPNVVGRGPKKIKNPAEAGRRRVIFVNDIYFDAIKARARADGKSPSAVIRAAVKAYLNL